MSLAWSKHPWPQLSDEAFFALLRDVGLKHYVHHLGLVEGGISTDLAVSRADDLQLAAVSMASTLIEPADLAAALRVVRWAGTLAVRAINLHVVVLLEEFASLPDFLTANLRRLADEAAAQDCIICLDSASGLGGSSRTIARSLQSLDHPALKLQFDTGGYVLQNPGAQVEVALQRLIGYVGSFRLSDAVEQSAQPDFPPLGQGAAVDFARVWQLVQAMQLDVPCEIFFRPLTQQPPNESRLATWLRESMQTLRMVGWKT